MAATPLDMEEALRDTALLVQDLPGAPTGVRSRYKGQLSNLEALGHAEREIVEIPPEDVPIDTSAGVPAPASWSWDRAYDFPVVPGVLSVQCRIQYQSGDQWSAAATLAVAAFGYSLGSTTLEVNYQRVYVDFNPSILLAKAESRWGFTRNSAGAWQFGVTGQACYWKIWSWSCTDFSKPALITI
ncbi:hypothetical protein ABZ769_36905 [Streptomyces olivoreticuli]